MTSSEAPTARPWRGVAAFTGVALACGLAGPLALRALGLRVGEGAGGVVIIALMFIPSLARIVAERVERGWQSPLSLRRWGRPRAAIVLVPLAIVVAVYGAAYLAAALLAVPREPPLWQGARAIALNLAVNAPVLFAIGLVGGLGEEWGWRGYLQPRLDQAGVRGSLFLVVAIETVFHVPVIALAGYLGSGSGSTLTTVGLFCLLKLGATPVWTFATYRWRSVWVAAWLHSIHNSLSQRIFPRVFGAGSETLLGESGLLPVMAYLLAAGLCLLWLRRGGRSWSTWAREMLAEPR